MKLQIVVLVLVVVSITAVARGGDASGKAGNALYDANCSVCHQGAGVGVPGGFPRLAGRAGALASVDAGRSMMIAAVLFGMSGKLQVDNQTIIGVMTPLPQLSDAEIANVLTYVSHLDQKAPKRFTAQEVKAVRSQPPLTSSEVNALARDPALTNAAP